MSHLDPQFMAVPDEVGNFPTMAERVTEYADQMVASELATIKANYEQMSGQPFGERAHIAMGVFAGYLFDSGVTLREKAGQDALEWMLAACKTIADQWCPKGFGQDDAEGDD